MAITSAMVEKCLENQPKNLLLIYLYLLFVLLRKLDALGGVGHGALFDILQPRIDCFQAVLALMDAP
jgi:hypothetical protein